MKAKAVAAFGILISTLLIAAMRVCLSVPSPVTDQYAMLLMWRTTTQSCYTSLAFPYGKGAAISIGKMATFARIDHDGWYVIVVRPIKYPAHPFVCMDPYVYGEVIAYDHLGRWSPK
jgi:hypothetical protein